MLFVCSLLTLIGINGPALDERSDPASLLPAATVAYIGTADATATAHDSGRTAMAQILQEAEVRAFLQKPISAAEAVVAALLTNSDAAGFELAADQKPSAGWLSDALLGGTAPQIGRAFVALTHIDLTGSPDLGLIIGVELLDPADAAHLDMLWSALGDPAQEATGESHGIAFASRPVEGTPLTAYFASAGNMALFSLSRTALDTVLGNVTGSLPVQGTLARTTEYAELKGRDPSVQAGDVVTFMRTEALASTLRTSILAGAAESGDAKAADMATSVLDGLGIDCLRLAFSTSRVNQRGRIETIDQLVFDPAAEGLIPTLLRRASEGQVDLTGLESIAGDVLGASLSVIDGELSATYDFAMQMLGIFSPDMRTEAESGINEFMAGASLRDDVLANIKGQIATFSTAGGGISPSPDWAMRMECDRPDMLIKAISTLVEALGDQAGFPVKIKVEELESYRVHNIDLSATPLGMQLSPALAIEGERSIVFSTSSKHLKTLLTQKVDAQSSLGRKESLAEFLGQDKSGGKISSIGYSNLAANFRAQYAPLAGMAPLLLSGVASDIPIELSKLPSPDAIEKHLGESFTTTGSPEPGVLVTRSLALFRASDAIPLIIVGGLIGAGEALGLEVTSAADTMDINPSELALNDLKEIRAALTVYKIAMDGYPTSLDALVQPIPAYDSGALPRESVPLDPWGNSYRYSLEQHPTKNRIEPKLWSAGPNGLDEQGGGDDVVRF